MSKEWSLSREGSLSEEILCPGSVSVKRLSLSRWSLSRVSLSSRVSVRETPSHYEQTDACENITLPQTSFAGGKYD